MDSVGRVWFDACCIRVCWWSSVTINRPCVCVGGCVAAMLVVEYCRSKAGASW